VYVLSREFDRVIMKKYRTLAKLYSETNIFVFFFINFKYLKDVINLITVVFSAVVDRHRRFPWQIFPNSTPDRGTCVSNLTND